jgi:hypothetical protein
MMTMAMPSARLIALAVLVLIMRLTVAEFGPAIFGGG